MDQDVLATALEGMPVSAIPFLKTSTQTMEMTLTHDQPSWADCPIIGESIESTSTFLVLDSSAASLLKEGAGEATYSLDETATESSTKKAKSELDLE